MDLKLTAMEIKKVTVFGTGNFGARIAYHIAFNRIDVTVYDRDFALLEEARTKFREFGSYYQKHFQASTRDIEAALANIAYSMDVTEAAGNAQLIVEAVAEDLQAKESLYRELKETAPSEAFLVTMTRGLEPDLLAKVSGRPDKFLALHFTGKNDHQNTIEILGLPQTCKDALQSVANFSEHIGLIPIIKKLEEQN